MLYLFFGIIAVGMIVYGFVSLYSIKKSKTESKNVFENAYQ